MGVNARLTPNFLNSTRRCAERTLHWERELATGKEARRIARKRHQVWFREKAGYPALLERLDDYVDARALVEQPRNTNAERHVVGHEPEYGNTTRTRR